METDGNCDTIAPIPDIAGLKKFLFDPPKWTNEVCDISSRSSEVVDCIGSGTCHYDIGDQLINPVRYNRNSVHKTLVCHDFKNGYLQDRFVKGCANEANGYVFDKWPHIDIFVYFSHHLITIPPLGWINVAHQHGVKILGTFITEWDDGKALTDTVFASEESVRDLVNDLIELTVRIKIDGWLINIENKISAPANLLKFVKYLTVGLHEKRPGSLVIWYDSVTETGDLKWQDELNSKNRCYFDVCDGIFLNYNWSVESLRCSATTALQRHLDVYAGIDVFGRGCYGNGRFHCHLAAREIRAAGLSMAIFAPAWTYETLPAPPSDSSINYSMHERFIHRDNAFWRALSPFLYTHPVSDQFLTTFHSGVDSQTFDVSKQNLLLHRLPHSNLKPLEEELSTDTLLKWRCPCIKLQLLQSDDAPDVTVCTISGRPGRMHKLLTCDLRIRERMMLVLVTETVEKDDEAKLEAVLLLEDVNTGSKRRVICKGITKDIKELRSDASTVEVVQNEAFDYAILKLLYLKQFPPTTKLSVYNLNFDNCRIMDISVGLVEGSNIRLRAIGISDAIENIFRQ